MCAKANLIDMKKTMAEVAANIESRVTYEDMKRMLEEKVSRSDFHFQIQNKPSFDDMKHIMEQMSLNGGCSPHNQEVIEDELAKMRQRIDDLTRRTNSVGSPKDQLQFHSQIEAKFAEFEEKLNEKANKQSVA